MNITPYKKRNGRTYYKLSAYLGMDPRTGRPVEITRQGFESHKDAQLHYLEELRKFEAQTEEGALLPAITFAELSELWLPVYERTVGESTYNKTEGYFRNHIWPQLGSVRLDRIDLPMLNRAVIDWSEKHSKSSTILGYVKRVLDMGIDLGYLRDHPGSKVKAPKKKKDKIKKELKFLEKEELITYLKAAEEHLDQQWYTFIRLLAMSGLRRGEALALKREDIEGDMLTVNKTIATGKKNRTYIGPPKSASSFRTIRMDQETIDNISKLSREPGEYLFMKNDGNYWSLSRPGHKMRTLSKKAGVPEITPHVLRHTHCALMFEAGAGLKEVQDRLGHEDIDITLSIYNHVSARRSHEAIDRFTSYLNGTSFGGNSVHFDSIRANALINQRSAK